MRKLFMIGLYVATALQPLRAQDDRSKVLTLMQQLLDTYRSTPYMSFDVHYKYAAEQAPAVYLDSLNGQFKLSNGRYWYNMDNTEAVCTNDYLIMLFKEDQVMYLTKPSVKAIRGMSNPVGLLDSLLLKNKDIDFHVRDEAAFHVIALSFSGNTSYKKIEYYIHKRSGLLQKTVNIVRAEELYESADRPFLEGAITYAIVEAAYSNYSTEAFDDWLFANDRYFRKQGAEYTAVTPFDSYKIFLGTPNL
jgi:hypothetical protein